MIIEFQRSEFQPNFSEVNGIWQITKSKSVDVAMYNIRTNYLGSLNSARVPDLAIFLIPMGLRRFNRADILPSSPVTSIM